MDVQGPNQVLPLVAQTKRASSIESGDSQPLDDAALGESVDRMELSGTAAISADPNSSGNHGGCANAESASGDSLDSQHLTDSEQQDPNQPESVLDIVG